MTYSSTKPNQAPYYDDVDHAVDSRYLRILFRPGRAVQARELTQTQSLLQKQIGHMGDHFFQNYTVISGGSVGLSRTVYYRINKQTDETFDPITFIGTKIKKVDANGNFYDSNDDEYVAGVVSHVEDVTTTDPYYVFYITYESGVEFTTGESFRRTDGEDSTILTITTHDDMFSYVFGSVDMPGIMPSWYGPTGSGAVATVTDGLFYVDGHFVKTDQQGVGVNKTENVTGTSLGDDVPLRNYDHLTTSVGFDIEHEVVEYTDDNAESLLDPSRGTSNFAAPGADRYRMSLTLGQREYEPISGLTGISEQINALDVIENESYFEVLRVKKGRVQSVLSRTGYASLEELLARRTHDESGNYTIRGFDIEVLEHLRDSGGTIGAVDGAYTSDQNGDKDHFVVKFSPGKAYVGGHELQSYHDTLLTIEKSREPAAKRDVSNDKIATNLGAHVIVDGRGAAGGGETFSMGGGSEVSADGFNTYEYVNLVGPNSTSFDGTGTSKVIGSARIRSLQFMEDDYKLFLSDVRMGSTGGTQWPQYLIESIHKGDDASPLDGSAAPGNKMCDIHPETGRFLGLGKTAGATGTYIFGKRNTTMMFTPDDGSYIEQINNLSYYVRKSFSGQTDAVGNDEKITLDDSLEGTIPQGASVKFPTITGTPDHQDFLVYSIGQDKFLENGTEVTYSISADQNECTVTTLTASEDFILFVVLEVSSEVGTLIRTKTLHKGITAECVLTADENGRYESSIGYADVVRINSITDVAGVDVTGKFKIDTGQRATMYDHASIHGDGSITSAGTYVVDFDYFSPSGLGPFTVNSYMSTLDGRYEHIPDFMSLGNRKTIHLRDAIDFRPVREPNADTFDMTWTPHHTTTSMGGIDCDYSHFMGRIDKLHLDPTGRFVRTKGSYAKNRSVPPSPTDGGMLLATMMIPPYVVDVTDIKFIKSDNDRYTMKDIGNIKRRIGRLEYETQLSALERSAESQLILDSAGNNRLKSGFLVDPMSGMNIVDTSDADLNIQVLRGYAEAPQFAHNIDLKTTGDVTSLVSTTDDIWMLPYEPETMINQTIRSNRISVNPYNIVSFVGEARISPQSDSWVDTETTPAYSQQLDLDATMQGLGEIIGQMDDVIHGTNINAAGFIEEATTIRQRPDVDWIYFFWSRFPNPELSGEDGLQTFLDESGLSDDALQYIETSGTNWWDKNAWVMTQGFEEVFNTTTSSVDLGNRITNTTIIPYMRANQIKIHFVGLTPNTIHYPFFDASGVSEHCTPATTWGDRWGVVGNFDEITAIPDATAGDVLKSDENGQLAVIFDLPGGIFRTGQRIFKITNDETNTFQHIGQPSFAEVEYRAEGLLQTMQQVVLETSLQTNGVARTDGQWVDLGTVDHARYGDPLAQTFMVSSDEYKDGIWAHSVDLFFARSDSTLPVNVQIKPVVNGYPSSGPAIAFASASHNPNDVVIPGGTPGGAASSTWFDDVESNLTRFEFSTPVYLKPGEYCIVITSNSDAYEVWYSNMGEYKLSLDGTVSTDRIMEQPYAGSFFKSQNSSTWTAEQGQDLCFRLNRCKFTSQSGTLVLQETVHDSDVATNYFPSAETVPAGDDGSEYKMIHYHSFIPSVITLSPSSTSTSHKTTVKAQSEITGNFGGTIINTENISNNMVPQSRKSIAVGVPDVDGWGDGVNEYSIKHAITLYGNEDTTPAIDGQSFSMKLSERVINFSTDTDPAENSYNGELEPNSTNNDYTPICRYITKPVVLSSGMDATNLHVTLTQYMPPNTEIQVFVRHLPDSSEENIRNQRWTQMWITDLTNVSIALDPSDTDNLTYNTSLRDIRDVQYQLPDDIDGGMGEYQVKIVLYGDVSSLIHPIVKNMRSIAVL